MLVRYMRLKDVSRYMRHLFTPVRGLNFMSSLNRRVLFQLTGPRTRASALYNKFDAFGTFFASSDDSMRRVAIV
jgi:hypothetical protein